MALYGTHPRRRKRWPVITVVVLVCLVCGGCSITGGLLLDAFQRQTRTTIVPVGGLATDGGLTFRIEQVDCSVTSVGQAPVTRRAHGRFCLVHLAVGNRGASAGTFLASLQRARDAQDREYSPDDAAGLLVNPDGWVSQVNPGSTLRGVIVFDMPVGVELTAVVVHGGMFGGGVKVRVR